MASGSLCLPITSGFLMDSDHKHLSCLVLVIAYLLGHGHSPASLTQAITYSYSEVCYVLYGFAHQCSFYLYLAMVASQGLRSHIIIIQCLQLQRPYILFALIIYYCVNFISDSTAYN